MIKQLERLEVGKWQRRRKARKSDVVIFFTFLLYFLSFFVIIFKYSLGAIFFLSDVYGRKKSCISLLRRPRYFSYSKMDAGKRL
ncbi:MAG: hypothetical protein ABIH83_01400 [Candidatus Micrarchaeota archaeon]